MTSGTHSTHVGEEKVIINDMSREAQLDAGIKVMGRYTVVEQMQAMDTLLVYTKNLIAFPDEEKYRKVKLANIHYQQRLGHMDGSLQCMAAIGYTEQGGYLRLSTDFKADGKKSASSSTSSHLHSSSTSATNSGKQQHHSANYRELLDLERYLNNKFKVVRSAYDALPMRLPETHCYSAVFAAGTKSDQGKRDSMEDDEIMVDRFCGDPNQAYFGLYDGHGGRQTVNFVVRQLHANIEQEMRRHPDKSVEDVLTYGYLATDRQLVRHNVIRSGSTSVSVVIRPEPTQDSKTRGDVRVCYTANAGDSRAVLVRDGQAIRLTVDHKPTLDSEIKRIKKQGGKIMRSRVGGVLAITRALGDHQLKNNDVITAEPFTLRTELTDADSYLILACDGVWDVMSDQEAADLVVKAINEEVRAVPTKDVKSHNYNEIMTSVSSKLVQEALIKKTNDNVTVMVVKLRDDVSQIRSSS